MVSITGLQSGTTYTVAVIGTGNKAKITVIMDELLALIPDPDVPPAQGGSGTSLDSMHPHAAAQLRVEIAALQVGITDA